jgi:hypothetical protein
MMGPREFCHCRYLSGIHTKTLLAHNIPQMCNFAAKKTAFGGFQFQSLLLNPGENFTKVLLVGYFIVRKH